MITKEFLEYAGQQIEYEIWGYLEYLDFQTKQYPELLPAEVSRAEGRQAEEEGNWMIWSTFQKTDMLPYQNKHY